MGADQDGDVSSYEATAASESATDGSMVYTYTIDDDDAPPQAKYRYSKGKVGIK